MLIPLTPGSFYGRNSPPICAAATKTKHSELKTLSTHGTIECLADSSQSSRWISGGCDVTFNCRLDGGPFKITCTLIIAVINTMPGPARATRGQDTGGVNTADTRHLHLIYVRGGESVWEVSSFLTKLTRALKWKSL